MAAVFGVEYVSFPNSRLDLGFLFREKAIFA